jgi:hypothetical protein
LNNGYCMWGSKLNVMDMKGKDEIQSLKSSLTLRSGYLQMQEKEMELPEMETNERPEKPENERNILVFSFGIGRV